MENSLFYKGYRTIIRYSEEDDLYYGKIEGISDLVSFGAEDMNSIEKVFHDAVDGYLESCKEHNKVPEKE